MLHVHEEVVVRNFAYEDGGWFEENANNFHGKHALVMINGFATNAHTGQAAYVPDMHGWHSRANRPFHAAGPVNPESLTVYEPGALGTLDGILRDGRQN